MVDWDQSLPPPRHCPGSAWCWCWGAAAPLCWLQLQTLQTLRVVELTPPPWSCLGWPVLRCCCSSATRVSTHHWRSTSSWRPSPGDAWSSPWPVVRCCSIPWSETQSCRPECWWTSPADSDHTVLPETRHIVYHKLHWREDTQTTRCTSSPPDSRGHTACHTWSRPQCPQWRPQQSLEPWTQRCPLEWGAEVLYQNLRQSGTWYQSQDQNHTVWLESEHHDTRTTHSLASGLGEQFPWHGETPEQSWHHGWCWPPPAHWRISCRNNNHQQLIRRLVFWCLPRLDMIQKLATRNFFKDQVKSIIFLKVLNQLNNVRVALTVMEQVNLLEDPGSAVGGHLLNDLDRVLHLGVDVDAGLDWSVGSLTQHLPCQLVQLLECVGSQGTRTRCLLLLSPPGLNGLFFASCDVCSSFKFFRCNRTILLGFCQFDVNFWTFCATCDHLNLQSLVKFRETSETKNEIVQLLACLRYVRASSSELSVLTWARNSVTKKNLLCFLIWSHRTLVNIFQLRSEHFVPILHKIL